MGLKNLWRIGGKSINIVSFGGGTNSAAVLVGLHKHSIPVDLILFADTGGEQPHTYQFIRTMNDWLAAHGMPQIRTRIHKRLSRVWKCEIMTIASADGTEIS